MKQCVQCRNELPDTAVHCVFCGAKQPTAMAKTVMGYPGIDPAQLAGAGARPGAPMGKSTGAPGAAQVGAFDQTQPLSNEAFREPSGAGGGYGPAPGPGQPVYGGPQPGSGPHGPVGPGGGPGPGMMGGPGPYGPPMGGPPGPYGAPPPGYGPGPGPGGYGPGPGPGPQGYGPGPGGYGPGPAPGPGGYGPPGPGPYGSAPPPGYGPGPGPGGYGPPMGPQGPGPYGPPPGPGGPGQGQGPGMAGYGPPPGYGPGPGPQGYGPPPGYAPSPETEPVRALRPPYLASESRGRASAPMEPWGESLKTLMLVFGVLLVACFVAPWRVVPGQTVFSWTILSADAPTSAKIIPLLLVGTGVLAVALGAVPVATIGRGFAAAGIGLAPVVYAAASPPFQWQALVEVIGVVALVTGLLVRSQYTDAPLGRIMTTVGVACVLLTLLVPEGGEVPLVAAFKALGTNRTVPALLLIVPAVLALASLVVWLPGPGGAGAHVLAWIWIVWPLAAAVLSWLSAGDIGPNLKVNLDGVLYRPMALMAWTALVGYGAATVVGKQLEHA